MSSAPEVSENYAPGAEPTAAGAAVEIGADSPVNNIEEAVEKVLGNAAVEGGIKIGCAQVIKAIEAGIAHYVFLAGNMQEAAIAQTVRLLAAQNNVPVIEVPEASELGRWAGLFQLDKEGKCRKIRGASSVALTQARKSQALAFIENHSKSSK